MVIDGGYGDNMGSTIIDYLVTGNCIREGKGSLDL
jgi:hypothetical protein